MRIVTLLLVVFSFKLKKASTSFECPDGWFKNEKNADNCYLYQQDIKNYTNSLLSCQSYGASLLSIQDEAENKFIVDYCSTKVYTWIWIGLHDNKSKSQRTFEWASGAPVLYTNWLINAPGNADRNENCVQLLPTGAWNDINCDWIFAYICKFKKESTSLECPVGWFKYAANCYLYRTDIRNHASSMLSCQSLGASLLSIEDEAENKFIVDHCRNLQFTWIWIGLHDTKSKSQRKFEWSNGTPVLYTNWLIGEPNNAGGNEGCVVLITAGKWNDMSCDKVFAYICKLEKDNANNVGATKTKSNIKEKGYYSVWSEWGACSEVCQSNPSMSPFQTQTRKCIGASLNGGCHEASSQTRTCNTRVPCPGYYGSWSEWGACSGTCQSNPSMSPFQTRTRQCIGATFNGGCYGESSQTRTCNTGVPCPGTISSWSSWSSCSATCNNGVAVPSITRSRYCIGYSTWDPNYTGCPGIDKIEQQFCNTKVSCPGTISSWSSWSSCSATCNNRVAVPSITRSRSCIGYSTWDPNYTGCPGIDKIEQQSCNTKISCPGDLTDWSSWIECTGLSQKRFRVCAGVSSFESNYVGCYGASLTDQRLCN